MNSIVNYMPDEISMDFENLIGLKNAKDSLMDVVRYVKDPRSFEALGVKPHMHYLIAGCAGCGKSALSYALAKECNIPIVVVNCIDFVNVKKKAMQLLNDVFELANSFGYYCVLFFKDFERLASIDSSFSSLFFNALAQNMINYSNLIIITTLSSTVDVSSITFLFEEKTFSKTIDVELPDKQTREAIYEKFCKNLPLASDVSFSRLAIDSYSMTPREIKDIVKNTSLLALRNGHEQITYQDFDDIISMQLLGQKRKKMTDKERRATAYHEAGHVVAGYFADPNYKLKKVEVAYRTQSLGITMEDVDEDKLSYFKTDWENQIISCFGGLVAERLIFGENSSGVTQDLVMATNCAASMITAYGMNETIGPISFQPLDESEILGVSDTMLYTIEVECQKLLKELYNKTLEVITLHKTELETLANALFEKEVVYSDEIEQIFKGSK